MNEIKIEELYNEFRKPLLRFIQYKVSDSFVAEKILNDVFFKASNSIGTLKEQTKLQSWLYKIASNLIIDYYRKHKNPVADFKDEINFDENIKDESILKDLSCCLDEILKQLPKSQESSLKAVYFDEQTQKEYALNNKLNLSSVKSDIRRGKSSVKEFFDKCCSFEKDKTDNIVRCISKDTNKEC